ncbi:MAG: CocE/NonD family hydrolase [Aerococcus sp.]|nr:CocE/NonD family hydrolase [Aerococcus sp.]
MIKIDQKGLTLIAEELLGHKDAKKDALLTYFRALDWSTSVKEPLSRLMAQDFTTTEALLDTILQFPVTRNITVLEQLFMDQRLPKFLEAYRPEGPIVFHDRTLMAYDETKAIKERVYVETGYSTTNSKYGDLTEIYIQRPREIKKSVGCPIIYVADPYMMGAVNEAFDKHLHSHQEDYRDPITDIELPLHPTPAQPRPQGKAVDEPREITLPTFTGMNAAFNHYLTKGYALVYYAGRGAYYSEGFNVTGTQLEVEAVDAVLRWVDGDTQGFYDLEAREQAVCDWSNGSVGMSGRSYLGTLQIGVASITQTQSLKTIVPEAAIASWYDYYRYNGLVVAPQAFFGEDIDLLTWFCESFLLNPTNSAHDRLEQWETLKRQIQHDMDRGSGQYNCYWDGGNYLNNADHIQVPFLFIQGTADWNVKTSHLFKLMKATANNPIQRNMIIHRGKHISLHTLVNDHFLKRLDQWFDHYLLGIGTLDWQNGDALIQSAYDPDQWQIANYDQRESQNWTIHQGQTLTTDESTGESLETLIFHDQANYPSIKAWETDVLRLDSETSVNWQSEPLKADYHIHGDVSVKMSVQASEAPGAVSAMLVDVGKAVRVDEKMFTLKETEPLAWHVQAPKTQFVLAPESDYHIITRGWTNLLNPEHRLTPLTKDEWSEQPNLNYEIDMMGMDYTVKAGHRLMLVVYGYDREYTCHPTIERQFTIDPNTISLDMDVLTADQK